MDTREAMEDDTEAEQKDDEFCLKQENCLRSCVGSCIFKYQIIIIALLHVSGMSACFDYRQK